MDKRIERILALAGGFTVVWLAVDLVLALRTGLAALWAVAPYLALGAALCWFVAVRMRWARRAEEEQRERALVRQERPESALFDQEEGELEPFSVGRSREQFERWVVPAFGLVLAVVEGYWAWRLFRRLQAPPGLAADRLLAAAFLAGQTFTLFLLSRYLLGLSRLAVAGTTARGSAGSRSQSVMVRLARGPGVMLGVGCFASLLVVMAAVGGQAGYGAADRMVVVLLTGFLAVLAVENVVSFIGELYRPRRGREVSRGYESRLGGLLTDPATWVRNVAGALDYQFGYKVSETWLYRFLERALLPLVLFQLLVLYGLSALVFLGPEEEAIVERFGRPRAAGWHLTSGVHWKWPWPFETVRRYPVKRVLRLEIGYQPEGAAAVPSSILWTVPHYSQEDQFLTASHGGASATNAAEETVPVNLMAFNMPVEYRIVDVRQYAYGCANPSQALESIAYRSLTLEAASRGLFDVMSEGRMQTAQAVQARIQREADQLGLGIRVVFVGLPGVHPPVSVAGDFESVVGATEESEAAVLVARTQANRVLPVAAAEAVKVGDEAAAYAVRRTVIASAEADRFLKRLDSYQRAPSVFRMRLYLGALQGGLVDCRKYIVAATPSNEVIQLDFTEKPGLGIFDFGSTGKTAPEKK